MLNRIIILQVPTLIPSGWTRMFQCLLFSMDVGRRFFIGAHCDSAWEYANKLGFKIVSLLNTSRAEQNKNDAGTAATKERAINLMEKIKRRQTFTSLAVLHFFFLLSFRSFSLHNVPVKFPFLNRKGKKKRRKKKYVSQVNTSEETRRQSRTRRRRESCRESSILSVEEIQSPSSISSGCGTTRRRPIVTAKRTKKKLNPFDILFAVGLVVTINSCQQVNNIKVNPIIDFYAFLVSLPLSFPYHIYVFIYI